MAFMTWILPHLRAQLQQLTLAPRLSIPAGHSMGTVALSKFRSPLAELIKKAPRVG
jgi:hypothetical protein